MEGVKSQQPYKVSNLLDKMSKKEIKLGGGRLFYRYNDISV